MLIATNETFEQKLEELRRLAGERLERAEAMSFTMGLDVIMAHAAREEIDELDIEELYGASLALWKFCRDRKPGQAKVRVYNPRMAEHGWSSRHTIVEIVNDDMPFLVDSTTVLMTEQGLGIHALMHPMMSVRRDDGGRRLGLAEPGSEGALSESVIHLQVDQIGEPQRLADLKDALEAMYGDVAVAVRDWRAMLARLAETTATLRDTAPETVSDNAEEGAAFLDWLADNHFTFLGCRSFTWGPDGGFQPVADSGLGLLSDPDYTVMRDTDGNFVHWTPELHDFATDDHPILVVKANRRATVHRGTHFDVVAVKQYAADGSVTGEQVFVGLFTSAAYNRSPHEIPMLREKLDRVIQRAGFRPASHDGKALDNVLETYPRDELFQSTDEQLYENAVGVLTLSTRPRTRLFMRPDRFGRFVSCVAYVPRERYTTELRVKIGSILCAAVNGRVASWEPSFDMEAMARVHFVIALQSGMPAFVVSEVEREVVEAVRSWSDRLMDALVEKEGEHKGHALHARFGAGFPASYREEVGIAQAVADIERLETLTDEAPLGLHFYRRLEDDDDRVRFKIFHKGGAVPLSDCLPVLEKMGFRVLNEHPYLIEGEGGETWIHDFLMVSATGCPIDLAKPRSRVKLEEGFDAVWNGTAENDPLNRLILLAGLSHRDVSVLRAYSRFLRQARIPYSIEYMEDALAEYPEIARLLMRVFLARFDPRIERSREERDAEAGAHVAEIEAALEAVPSLDVDRILRRFLNAIRSTLRTNVYQPGPDGALKAYLSFKLDSGALDDLPLPRPWREIFVFSPWVEGVHLRGGPVARGGLRWSDRKEDFRTEVLGLVKAQQVKNSVIVPVGSKGGFLPKKLPAGGSREEVQAEAIRCYKTFLSGLLDITDNLVQGDIVPPQSVVRYDADDPYLVVAADKGTATFSDIANGLAQEYGFWLDDAFASGGSNGYDHKGMGITAKGGWEAVKRHFRELGHDTQSEPFTVMGCGDMSGDVFGNGMLLSDQIRLQAAFDHRDIFIDPDPDHVTTFPERKRLFEMGRSSWQDYDRSLISPGGGVFSRAAKSVQLTPEIQALLEIEAERVTPAELIKAIMGARVDLFWFGGIGTYIKAAEETHSDVGDKANEALRVDAAAVRARVVGEGANLGVTQMGRIALARRGVKINTDAVDNSAGVDCSDHEVNIKIALGQVVQAGDMTEKQRNGLLAEMTDRVAELVLGTNYTQTLCISMAEARAPQLLDAHWRFMRGLESRGLLNRAVELLPDDEAMGERAAAGEGLTRPEIAVLVSYAKLTLFDDIVAGPVPDDPHLEHFLIDYFPEALAGPYGGAVRGHRLRREIIATVLANIVVNEGGASLVARLAEDTGASTGEIVEAFFAAREILGVASLQAEIDALDNEVPAAVQIQMHTALSHAMTSQLSCILSRPSELDTGALVGMYAPGMAEVSEALPELLTDFSKERLDERVAALVEAGVPEELAVRVSGLEFQGGVLDIVDVAGRTVRDVHAVAETYFAAGARFGLDWLRTEARGLAAGDHWEGVAVGRLISDLRAQQSQIAAAALARDEALLGADAVGAWADAKAEDAGRADKLMAELKGGAVLSVAKLAVAASAFRSVVGA
ncbi:MAG: NAD-glutamate dehydrogenase [Pseudomonadota bacterium]